MNGIHRPWVARFLVLAPAAADADYDAGDYAAAMREWRPLAEASDAKVQWGMGNIYRFGRGVEVDDLLHRVETRAPEHKRRRIRSMVETGEFPR
jgi:TPR repeat protein